MLLFTLKRIVMAFFGNDWLGDDQYDSLHSGWRNNHRHEGVDYEETDHIPIIGDIMLLNDRVFRVNSLAQLEALVEGGAKVLKPI
jgi:hypothetical protein